MEEYVECVFTLQKRAPHVILDVTVRDRNKDLSDSLIGCYLRTRFIFNSV